MRSTKRWKRKWKKERKRHTDRRKNKERKTLALREELYVPMKPIQRLWCVVRIAPTDCAVGFPLTYHPMNPSANKGDDVVSLSECATAWRYCKELSTWSRVVLSVAVWGGPAWTGSSCAVRLTLVWTLLTKISNVDAYRENRDAFCWWRVVRASITGLCLACNEWPEGRWNLVHSDTWNHIWSST